MSTYHLRGQSANMECSVIFLDSSSCQFEINGQSHGSALYDIVINHLDTRNAPLRIKRELFGLQYKDVDETTKWLDLNAKLRKQLGGSNCEHILEFKVHFFVSTGLIETLDPLSLKMYFLQIRTMLQQGVLKPRSTEAALIGALVVQIEIGDYKEYFNEFEQSSDYLHQIIIYPDHERKPDLLNRIAQEHKKLRGIDPQVAMRLLVEHVSKVERYGIEIHCAKSIINPTTVLDTFERPDTLIEIGVSSEGICVFKNGIKDEQDLAWKHIDKIQCNRKQFILVIQADSGDFFKINFSFSTNKNCKACFLSCQAHHQFFQSQLSIEPSTSSAYPHNNTEFLCRSGSILRNLGIVGARPRRRYLQASSNTDSTCSEHTSSRNSTAAGSSQRNSVAGHEHVAAQSYSGVMGEPELSHLRVDTGAGVGPGGPYGSSRNFVFPAQEVEFYPIFGGSAGGVALYPPPGFMLSPSERSTDSYSVGDPEDDFEDDDDDWPYYVGDRPDPLQLPTQCNTYFDPTVDLQQSMEALQLQLTSIEGLVMDFQTTPHLRRDFTVNTSMLWENQDKNRYQDILPYDRSRVILRKVSPDSMKDEDYINANHLVMILPDKTRLNYIAAQGPLEKTVADFWRMIWDQNCSVVVMLTNVYENDHCKCHQYWPENTNKSMRFGKLVVSYDSPPLEENYVTTREIRLENTRFSDSPRFIHLLHYTKWPDKGVPDNSEDFLAFVERVRRYRAEFLTPSSPLLVHCSAGIGRTGVFIIMETACKLIEQNQPVLPLDLVRVLRDQRPYMIQTHEQFTFVCEAILNYYAENHQHTTFLANQSPSSILANQSTSSIIANPSSSNTPTPQRGVNVNVQRQQQYYMMQGHNSGHHVLEASYSSTLTNPSSNSAII